MRYSVNTITGTVQKADTARAAAVGFFCSLGVYSGDGALSLRRFVSQLQAPLQVQQYKLYFNDFGDCVGYVTWAYLAPDVEKRLLSGEDYRLHTCEWNEGTSLWIMDMSFPHGSIKHVLKDWRDNLFKNFDTLTYFRVKSGKRIFKRVSRADGGYFFRKS